jgi:hypothetical protein
MYWDTVVREVGVNLGTWLVAAPLGFLSGLLFVWISQWYFRKKPIRQMIGFDESIGHAFVLATPVYIVPGTTQTKATKGVPLFGLGPVFAYHHFRWLLQMAYPQAYQTILYTADSFPTEMYARNLILLGFPLSNPITQRVMADLSLPVAFKNHDLVDAKTGKTLHKATVEKDEVLEDFGCLIRAPSPYHHGAVIFILAGCQTYGVKAAADFLRIENLSKIWNIGGSGFFARLIARFPLLSSRRKRNEFYQIIVKIKIRQQYFTSAPELNETKKVLWF